MSVSFRLRIATPLAVGWYDPGVVDRRWYVRPTSLKGVWRWWARAAVAGVMYDAGCLNGVEARDVVLKPSEKEAEAVASVVGKALGLGFAGEREAARSRYVLRVRVYREPQVSSVSRGNTYVRLPDGSTVQLQRLTLLALGRPVEYALGGDFEVSVEGPAERAPLLAMAVALTLGGVGKGSRKGLGSLDVYDVRGPLRPTPVGQLLQELYGAVERLAGGRCGKPSRPLPPMPALSKSAAEVHFIRGVKFADVHNFFLRPQRARVIYGRYDAEDELRKRLDAWVLGLPRSQRGTGYFIESKDIDRRASTFMVSYHTASHVFAPQREAGAYLTVMCSGDWPKKLSWSDHGEEEITLDLDRIKEACDAAKGEFLDYVKRLGGTPQKVWP